MKKLNAKWVKDISLLGIVFLVISLETVAQSLDSIIKPKSEFKNTIHFNITNPLIFGRKSIIFGYERILRKNCSISINAGQASFSPFNFLDGSKFKLNTILNEKGLNLSGDFRFYFNKLNRYAVPRGGYIGPYYSYNSFEKKHSWEYSNDIGLSQTVKSALNISIHTIGFEMGYQFVFWKRFALDMILLGPGIAEYNLKSSIGGIILDGDKQLFFDKINEALKDKFPGYNALNIDKEFKRNGHTTATSIGYRYMVQVGYRF